MANEVALIALVSFVLSGNVLCVCNIPTAAVTTASGQVIGCQISLALQEKTITWKEYLGIPYASPPTGELRFQKTVPVVPWNNTFIASKFGKICIQFAASSLPMEGAEQGEDCLSLNIFVPMVSSSSDKKAVMVFVHGGSFTSGSSQPFNGTALAIHGDVILVSVNYRLGPLGFLSTGDESAPGNMALWDITEALKWLNKNIEVFGGDPQKVTLFGESAGAIMVSNLITSPLIDTKLIQRAIMQSGSFLFMTRSTTQTVQLTGLFASQLNCSAQKSDDVIKCLRRVPIQSLVEGAAKAADIVAFLPVTDGVLLTLDHCNTVVNLNEGQVITTGNMAKFDVMIGHNSQEGLLAIPIIDGLSKWYDHKNISQGISANIYAKFLGALQMALPTQARDAELLSKVVRYYYEHGYTDLLMNRTTEEKRLKWATEMFGDMTFVWPSIANAMLHQRHSSGSKAYFYVFNHKSAFMPEFWYEGPDWLKTGSDHFDELPYVFGYPLLHSMPEAEKNLSLSMITHWTNFAKFGNPAPGTNIWPVFTDAKDYVTITAAGLQKANNPASDRANFWNAIMSSACQRESGPQTAEPPLNTPSNSPPQAIPSNSLPRATPSDKISTGVLLTLYSVICTLLAVIFHYVNRLDNEYYKTLSTVCFFVVVSLLMNTFLGNLA